MKKRKKKMAMLMLVASLFMTSCTKEDEFLYTIEAEDIPGYDKSTELDEEELNQIEKNKLIEEVIDEIEDIPVDYKYLEDYPTNDEIDAYVEKVSIETNCQVKEKYTADTMYQQIYENTKASMQQSDEYSNPFNEEDFCKAFKIVLAKTFEEENDISEDCHRLSGASILLLNSDNIEKIANTKEAEVHPIILYRDAEEFVVGEYRFVDNVIVLYKKGIDLYYNTFVYGGSYESYYTIILSTLLHEINHLKESICECRIKQGATTYRGIDYDGDYVPSLSESSCESALYLMDLDPYEDQKVYDDYSYPYERKSEVYLMFLALFNEDAKTEDYYHAMFDTDLNALYNFFHLENREDIYAFYRIMYTMDTLNFRTTLAENFNEENIQDEIGNSYRIAIMKRTLVDMIEYTNHHPEFTLEENILLYQIVKNYLTDEAYGYTVATSPSGYEYYANTYDEEFLKALESMDSLYISFLKNYYETTYEEIQVLKKKNVEKTYYYLSYGVNAKDYEELPKEISSLLERFPILKNIMTKYELPYTSYENYMTKGKVYIDLKN